MLFARELRANLRNPLLWALVVFASVLAAASAHMSAEDLKARVAAQAELIEQRDRERARQDGQVTGLVTEPGFRAIRPPDPLSTLVIGLDSVLPHFWDFGPSGRRSGRLSVPDPLHIDLEFVIRVVLGLLAVLLVLEAVGEERSNGTLLALLGHSVRSSLVMMAKLGAAALTLAGAVAVIVGITVVGVYLGGVSVNREIVLSAVLVGVAGWIYLFAYFAIGAFIASLVSSFGIALAGIIVIWLLGGVIAHPLAELTARLVSRTPPDSLLAAQSDRLVRERIERAQMQMGDEYLATVPADVHWARLEADQAAYAAAIRRLQPIWDSHIESLGVELEAIHAPAAKAAARQARIARWLGVLSPGAQFTGAAMNLAGVGNATAARWDKATGNYQRILVHRLFYHPPRLMALVPQTASASADEARWVVALSQRPLPTFESLPRFQPPARGGLAERCQDALPNLAALLTYALGFAAAATVAFTRIRL